MIDMSMGPIHISSGPGSDSSSMSLTIVLRTLEKENKVIWMTRNLPDQRKILDILGHLDDSILDRMIVIEFGDELRSKLNGINGLLTKLEKNDLLIMNNTKVFPAKLYATKDRTDAKVEIFLLRELGDRLWEVLVKPARKVRIGNKLILSKDLFCDVIDNTVSGGRVVRFEFGDQNFDDILNKIGHPPLPPYIERPTTKQDTLRYQTVYAEKRGAVAAPIAGLHFTPELITALKKKGVRIYNITLHIGLGTFKPVQVEDLNRHHMDSEYFEVSPETALAINEAKRKRRRIFAVGTSTVRALETVNVSGFQISPKKGWTNKFIHPPHEFKIVDGLITSFHQPESTLLMLTSAFAGYNFVKQSYKEAKKKNYRFLSYGDAMLIT